MSFMVIVCDVICSSMMNFIYISICLIKNKLDRTAGMLSHGRSLSVSEWICCHRLPHVWHLWNSYSCTCHTISKILLKKKQVSYWSSLDLHSVNYPYPYQTLSSLLAETEGDEAVCYESHHDWLQCRYHKEML